MSEDNADSFFAECDFENDPGIDKGGRDPAFADFFVVDEGIGLIEAEDEEDFAFEIAEKGPEVGGGCRGIFEYGSLQRGKVGLVAAAQFEGGDDRAGFRIAEALEL